MRTLTFVLVHLVSVGALLLAGAPEHARSTARILPLHEEGWAGSSVNVVGGLRQPVFTDSVWQYAGFFDASGSLVLAKRRMGSDDWELHHTRHQAEVANAHNSVSLGVDGTGRIHVALTRHNGALRYFAGRDPGSLVIDEPGTMVGRDEDRVTYPQFVRLPDGDLLFLYRSGGSGDGSLVLNRYEAGSGEWHRIHDNLIDGEGRRSAYWDLFLDRSGTLHLAWNWRETPDVSTNHDIAYARSDDKGRTWRRTNGSTYQLPITAASAEYAARIPQESNLMNPPVVAAGNAGTPFIASYWSRMKGEDPRYHLVYLAEGEWRMLQGPKSRKSFSLKGEGTKAPPLSRAALIVEQSWNLNRVHLIYRDSARGGSVRAATASGFPDPQWSECVLVDADMGAWEPSLDPVQAGRLNQAHFLLQRVSQLDGNDLDAAPTRASPVFLGVWSPDWERHQAQEHQRQAALSAVDDLPLDAAAILEIGGRSANWQWEELENGSSHHFRGWVWAPFYIGTLEFARAANRPDLTGRVRVHAESLYWKPHHRMYDADDHCVIQAYATLYELFGDKRMIRPSRERFDSILERPSPTSLDWRSANARDRWSWCDALFMGPPAWLMLGQIIADDRYLEFMNDEWWATTERLYNRDVGLYFRDESFLDVREPNGQTVHWARGNGWVIAGLARVLERFPRDHPDHERYLTLYREMCAAFKDAQQPDGLWRPGLLDPDAHPVRETSGSSFITFGIAWGINNGVLDAREYGPVVRRGWHAIAAAVNEEGRLEHVQPIGAAPHGFDPRNSEPFAVGAFLLAASEVLELAR